ncbi:purine-binding chemotaxis protein CheW [Fulvivirga sp. 29W222]|uniref:Purine-binding chemotaxis protein CheW n=1 Tax=Fulvivirga marina TaxID=2494733 RepID=A0A937KC68_9BACT|nr:chemotaxis protein CheW [Fulvivirga marina]MBL6447049.1 purine-binding chemotaxis protein CheW [Fulvivirga marina]
MLDQEKHEAKTVETEQLVASQQLIVFRQGDEEYGIHIDQIKEVVLTPNITKMPQTRSFVKGVANIRGNIIGIVDLEEKFGLKEATTTAEANEANNYTLVIESEDYKVGILVTEVPNTLTIKSSNIEQSVNVIHDNNLNSDYIKGLVKLDNRLIILIDIFKVLDEPELETLAALEDAKSQ